MSNRSKSIFFQALLVVVLFLSGFEAYSQLNAVNGRHETDLQTSITINLDGALAGNYNSTAGWSLTIGGSPVAITSVTGVATQRFVIITFGTAIGVGQSVIVNFTGDAVINPITNLNSQNNRVLDCSDFKWEAVFTDTPPCAPVTPITKMVFSIKKGARNSNLFNFNDFRVNVNWGVTPSVVSQINEYQSDASGNPAVNSYYVTFDAASSGFSYPSNENVCGYTSTWRIFYSAFGSCPPTSTGQIFTYASFNTDASGEGDGALSLPPTIANTDQVCLGNDVGMTFSDNTNRNCAPDADGTGPIPIHDATRWVRVRYGYPDAGSGLNIPNVFVGSTQVTDASGNILPAFTANGFIPLSANALGTPDINGVVTFGAPQSADANQVLEMITTSSPAGQVVGQVFNVTLEYWNQCNMYNFPSTANSRSVVNKVIIIDTPSPPVVPNLDICSGESRTLSVSPVVAGLTYRWYANATDAANQTNVLQTGSSFTPTSGQAPAGQTTTFYVRATQGNGCVSNATAVTLKRRSTLSTSGLSIQGPGDLCPNSSYVFQVNLPAPAGSPGSEPAQYRWQVPAGWTVSPADGIGQSVTITTDNSTGSKTLTVNYEYKNLTSNNTQCGVTFNRSVNVHAKPATTISPDPANFCEGSSIQLNGNPSLSFGTISTHLWTGDVSILDATNVQNPNTLTGASPGSYNLTYTVFADYGSGVSCSNSDDIAVNISASPTPASVGPNQSLCQVSKTSNPLGGSNPSPGTGTWSVVSKPGGSNVNFDGGINTPGTTITVDKSGIYVVRWTVVNGTCTSSADVQVDFGTDPGPQDAGSNNAFCGLAGSLNAVAPTVGSITWSQQSGPGTTSFSSISVNNPTITVTAFGTYTYRYRVVSGTCSPQDATVQITFNQAPTSTPMASFQSCVDPVALAAIPITGTVGGGATGGRWEVVSGTGTFDNGSNIGATVAGTTIADNYHPTSTDFTNGSVNIKLVASGASAPCTEVGSTITITFDRKPTVVSAGADQPLICADPGTGLGSATLTASAPNNGGTGTWSAAGGISFSNVNSPGATVSNLPAGPNTLTWTVTSALGVCSSQPSTVVITVNALPNAIDPAPSDLCESTAGSGSHIGADLTGYNDAVTGISGSTNRTIEWYSSLPRIVGNKIATPNSFTVSNGQVLYTRVINATTNCFRDGQVTFTINPLPVANAQSIEFCEEFPAGSNKVNGIDLTSAAIINGVTGGAGTSAVTWFTTQAGALNNTPGDAVASPSNLNITGSQSVFARVRNTVTGCINVSQVDLVIKPRPATPVIAGSQNQCTDGFGLYSITPVASATYNWTIDPAFDLLAGGGVGEFISVLGFPTATSGDVKVKVVLNGCESVEATKTVTVQSTPPVPTISASKDPVCSNESSIVYTATSLPNTDYTWVLPGTTGSIIGGQGTNQVTVNIGTVSGNIEVTPQTQGGGCASTTPATYFIDIRERPVMASYAIKEVCSDVPIEVNLDVTGTSVPAPDFNITNVTIPPGLNPSTRPVSNPVLTGEIFNDSYTNTTGGNLDVRYTVVPRSAEGCEGTAKDIFVRIKPEPTLNPNLDKTLCSRNATGIVLTVANNSVSADQYEVVSITPGGLSAIAGNPQLGTFGPSEIVDDVWVNTTTDPVTVIYNIRPKNSVSGCLGDPPLPVQVVVNPEPVINSVTSETICSGTTPTVPLTSTLASSTFTWTVKSTTGSISGQSNGDGASNTAINNLLVNALLTSGNVVYELKATGPAASGSCVSQPVDMTVQVDPAPASTNVDQIVCSDTPGGNMFNVDLQSLESGINSGGGLTFTWYQDLSLTTQITSPGVNAYDLSNGVPVYAKVDNGQCVKVQPVTYTINPSPSVTASITSDYNGFQLSCNGSSNGQITAAGANGTAPFLYSIDGGTSFFTSTVFNGLSAAGNSYTVTIRDAKGCVNTSTPLDFVQPTVLTGTPAITSNYNGRDITCQGASDGIVKVTPGGGAGSYTYQILELPSNTTGNASGVYSGLKAGSYTFVVKDINNCQLTTNTITLTDPTIISASATLTNPATCNGDADGQITVTASGGTLVNPNYTFTLVQSPFTANNTGIFTGLPASTYSVTVKDDNNCVGTSNSIVVTQPTTLTAFAAVTSNYNGAKISCPGAGDGQVTVSSNGGNGGYTYALDQDGANLTGQTDGSFENLGPGNFTITVKDSKNCMVTTASVNIVEPLVITPASSITSPITCNGFADGQITITATGGTGAYTFTQLPSTSNASGVFGGLTQGTYDFTVADLNGCTVPIQKIISEPTAVTASAAITSNYNGSQISCNGSSDGIIKITGSGGTGSLTYTFDQFSLTNTTGQFSGIFSGVPAGTSYTFTVKDVNSCTVVTVPVDVTEPPVVTGSGVVSTNYNGFDITCIGAADGAITITPGGGSGAPYSYTLDQNPANVSGQASGVFSGLAAGSYTVTVKDVNSCFVKTSTITVSSPTAVAGSATVNVLYNGRQITCNGASDGQITVTASGGASAPAYSFALNEIPANTSGQANGIFTGVPAGSYSFTITDGNGCQKITTPVTVNEPTLLVASAAVSSNYNGEQVSCNGFSDGSIKITASGGTTAYSYTFNEVPANVSGQNNGIFTGIPASASYSFTVRDVNNCVVVTSPIAVSEPPVLTASAAVTSDYNGQQISCNGVKDGTITITTGGGTGVPTYVFDQFAATNLTGKFSGIFSSVPAGTGYTFTTKDINGCTVVTPAIDVIEPTALSASGIASSNYSGFNISCFNLTDGEVTVTAGGGTGALTYSVLESPGNVTGETTGIFNGLRAGSYRVRVTDINNCNITTTAITVTQPTDITIQIQKQSPYNGSDISCAGTADGIIELKAGSPTGGAGGYTYALDQDGANTSGDASGTYTGLIAGIYTVTTTDANGCPKTSLPVVLLDPLPLFEGIVGLDRTICIGQGDPAAFTELAPVFGGVGNYAYQWYESTDNATFTPITGETNATYDAPGTLTQTTYYKREVTSGSCATLESNVVKVTVNALPTAVFSPSKTPVCEGDFFLLNFEFTGAQPYRFDYNDGTTFVTDRIGANSTPVPILNYTNTTTYTLTRVKDFNGCEININQQVTVPVVKINAAPMITSPTAQCGGSTFSFQWNVDPDVEYVWYWNDGSPETIAANSLPTGINTIDHIYNSINPSNSTNIVVTLSAENVGQGCGPKLQNMSVTLYPAILIVAVPDKDVICSGETIKVSNSTAGGTSHHWYYRRQGVSEVVDERNRTATTTENFTIVNTNPQNPLDYEIVYEVDNGNCSDDLIIPIKVYKDVTADFNIGTVPLFSGGHATVSYTNTSVPPYNDPEFDFDWDFGSGVNTITDNSNGSYDVDYTTYGSKTIRLVATNLVAQGDGLTCTSTQVKSIVINLPPLNAAFDYEPKEACFPSNIEITSNTSGGDSYEWRVVDLSTGRLVLMSNERTPIFNIVNPGSYAIYLKAWDQVFPNIIANSDNAASPAEIYPIPFANFDVQPKTIFIPDDELLTYNLSNPTGTANSEEYVWDFGDGTGTSTDYEPTYKYDVEGAYTVTMIMNEIHNSVVCSDTASIEVIARDVGRIDVPNAFTPNPSGPNDGTKGPLDRSNDVFLPIFKGNVLEFKMQVYDRWGNLLFESTNKDKGWNGYDKNGTGRLLPAGVYVYKIDLLFDNNTRGTRIGDITLVR